MHIKVQSFEKQTRITIESMDTANVLSHTFIPCFWHQAISDVSNARYFPFNLPIPILGVSSSFYAALHGYNTETCYCEGSRLVSESRIQ